MSATEEGKIRLKVDEILAEFLSKELDSHESKSKSKQKKKKKHKKHKHKKSKSHDIEKGKSKKRSKRSSSIVSSSAGSEKSVGKTSKHKIDSPCEDDGKSKKQKLRDSCITSQIESDDELVSKKLKKLQDQKQNFLNDESSAGEKVKIEPLEDPSGDRLIVTSVNIASAQNDDNICDNSAHKIEASEDSSKTVSSVVETRSIQKECHEITKVKSETSDNCENKSGNSETVISQVSADADKSVVNQEEQMKSCDGGDTISNEPKRELSKSEGELSSTDEETLNKSKKKAKKHKKDKKKARHRGSSVDRKHSHHRSKHESISKSRSRHHRSRSRSSDHHHRRSRSSDRRRKSDDHFWDARDHRATHSRNLSDDHWKEYGQRRLRLNSKSPGRSYDKDSLAGCRNITDLREKIDKNRLLEIARKNVMSMLQTGQLPPGVDQTKVDRDQLVAITSGGQSVEELTDFCKSLARDNDLVSSSNESDSSDDNKRSDDEKAPFINHPFKVNECKPNIVMKIRNSVQVPVKTPAEKVVAQAKLRLQFPVSSGTQHRNKESEWVPVKKDNEEQKVTASVEKPVIEPAPKVVTSQTAESVFPNTEAIQDQAKSLDLGNIVSERLTAIRKLQENPHDVYALGKMYKAQQQMQTWVQSKMLPGQFVGSTGAQMLKPDQLSGPQQAWVKKDQFQRAQKVEGGMGMYLLQKMGWTPGTGLGKNREGTVEPLVLDIKMDKKGLVSTGESTKKNANPPIQRDLSGKHPVSALMELCTKRKWQLPQFQVIFDGGPDHKKNFLFKVRVNNVEYQPTIASTNKKHAKAQSATVCLQAMGLLPK